MVPPLLVLVAVADEAVVETDPVEVPALMVARPVVWATDSPNWVSRSPSEMPVGGGGVGNVPNKPCRAAKTGEPAAIEPRRVIGFRASQVMKARIDRALAK